MGTLFDYTVGGVALVVYYPNMGSGKSVEVSCRPIKYDNNNLSPLHFLFSQSLQLPSSNRISETKLFVCLLSSSSAPLCWTRSIFNSITSIVLYFP